MKNIWLVTALLSLGLASAIADEYYIVRDTSNRQCKVVESPPITTELVLINDGSVYFERNQAESALASAAECNSPNLKAASPVTSLRKVQAEGTPIKPKRETAAKKQPNQVLAHSQRVTEQRDPLSSIFALFR